MPSIGVLEHNQSATDRPKKHVKRADGQSQVRRGAGFWIKKNVLLKLFPPRTKTVMPENKRTCRSRAYQHHIEPKIFRVNRREMEELERYQQAASAH